MATDGKRIYITTGRSGGKSWLTEEMTRLDLSKSSNNAIRALHDVAESARNLSNKFDDFINIPTFHDTVWFKDLIKKENEKMFIKNCYAVINGKKYYPTNVRTYPRLRSDNTEYMVDMTIDTGKNFAPDGAPFDFIGIKDVIFNNPVTIVLWNDGTKTIVKCEGEEFDAEKAIAMAFMKRAMGNKGSYYNTIRKWLENGKYYGFEKKAEEPIVAGADPIYEAVRKVADGAKKAIMDTFLGNH